MTTPDLLAIGDCNPDVVLDGAVTPEFGQVEKLVDDAELVLGGSASIVACGAARLGLRTALAAVVGDDVFGHSQLDGLAAHGVDTTEVAVDTEARTGVSMILRRGDNRAILTALGATATLGLEHAERALRLSPRHVHVSSYFLLGSLTASVPRLFDRAREGGATTSLDTNWDPSERWSASLDAALEGLDYFMPNAQEAIRITGCGSAREAAGALAERIGTVAVKLGADGAYARAGEVEATAPAVELDVVDSVGAGDSFNAGFLTAQLRGWDLDRSLRVACACGSLSTRCTGGTGAQPTMAEALAAAGLDFK
jgi:sugar/nucleoside kinase (ribokinase family)